MEADNASYNYKSESPQAAQVPSSPPSPQPRVRQLSTAVHFCLRFPISSILFGRPKENKYTFLDHKLLANKALACSVYALEAIVETPKPIRRARRLRQVEHKTYSSSLIGSQVGTEGKSREIYSGLLHMATQAKPCMSPWLCNLVTFNYLSLYNLIHRKEPIEPRNSLPSVRKNTSPLLESVLILPSS